MDRQQLVVASVLNNSKSNKLSRTFATAFIALLVFILILTNNYRRYPTIVWEELFKPPLQNAFSAISFRGSVDPPGVILAIGGGLGNQLFKYACAYGVSKEMGWPLYVYHPNRKSLIANHFNSQSRSFALDNFRIPLTILKYPPNSSVTVHISDETMYHKHYRNLSCSNFIYLDSYCQSEHYWVNYKKDILNMFQFRKGILDSFNRHQIVEQIRSTNSIAVHVRRGDFLGHDGVYYVPILFQRAAIRKMDEILLKANNVSERVYYVFSDDIEFVKTNFANFLNQYKFVFVSSTDRSSLEDFYLMTQCKHIIFPTSTFGWWAAYLNENPKKVVITSEFNPKFWTRRTDERMRFDNFLHSEKYLVKNWIVIPFKWLVSPSLENS